MQANRFLLENLDCTVLLTFGKPEDKKRHEILRGTKQVLITQTHRPTNTQHEFFNKIFSSPREMEISRHLGWVRLGNTEFRFLT